MSLHERLIQRRVALWNGRISEYAAVKTFQLYEFLMLAYLSAIVCVVVGCSCTVANADAASNAFFVLAFVLAALFLCLGLRAGRAGALDIARQYGLPDRAWRRMKVKTPEQFDRWLSSQSRGVRPPGT